MANPYMTAGWTISKLREEIEANEYALDCPYMTEAQLAECRGKIEQMQEALAAKEDCPQAQAMNAGYEDYEDMIYDRGKWYE